MQSVPSSSAAAAASAVQADDSIDDGFGYSRLYGGCRTWALVAHPGGAAADPAAPRWASSPLSTLPPAGLIITTSELACFTAHASGVASGPATACASPPRVFTPAIVYELRVALLCSGGQPCKFGANVNTVSLQFPTSPILKAGGFLDASSTASVAVAWTPFAFDAGLFTTAAARSGEFGDFYAAPGTSFIIFAEPAVSAVGTAAKSQSFSVPASPAIVEGLEPSASYVVYVEQHFVVDVGSNFSVLSSRAFLHTPGANASAAQGYVDRDIPVTDLFPPSELDDLVDALYLSSPATTGSPSANGVLWTFTISFANVPCNSLTADLVRAILADLRTALNISREQMKYAKIRCVATDAILGTSRRLLQEGSTIQAAFIVRSLEGPQAAALLDSLSAVQVAAKEGTLSLPTADAAAGYTVRTTGASIYTGTTPPPRGSVPVLQAKSAKAAVDQEAGSESPRTAVVVGVVVGVAGAALLVTVAVVTWRRLVRLHARSDAGPAARLPRTQPISRESQVYAPPVLVPADRANDFSFVFL
eukprot:tig00000882_g5280.t1